MRTRDLWSLEPGLRHLNHGSFGACPKSVLDVQGEIRAELEAQPMAFFAGLEARLDRARAAVADFVGADPRDLGFVSNATTGVNAVLGSLDLAPGDEIVALDHGYNACLNAARYRAERAGARLVLAHLPFPVGGPAPVLDAVLGAVTARTRLAMIDHVTSATALVLPVSELCAELASRGVDVLIDGAHAPGMLPLDLGALAEAGCTHYAANLHKWVCAPKGAGFLWVRRDRQDRVHPTVISHGYNSRRRDRSRFLAEFDWVGTDDPSAVLAVPAAIETLGGLLPGGWPALMARNHDRVLEARALVAAALGVDPAVPPSMIGSMASLPLADAAQPRLESSSDPLQDELVARAGIQTMIPYFPAPPRRLVRLSFAVYNEMHEFEQLAQALAGR